MASRGGLDVRPRCLSPRVRGNRRGGHPGGGPNGSIPARAGEQAGWQIPWEPTLVYPRDQNEPYRLAGDTSNYNRNHEIGKFPWKSLFSNCLQNNIAPCKIAKRSLPAGSRQGPETPEYRCVPKLGGSILIIAVSSVSTHRAMCDRCSRYAAVVCATCRDLICWFCSFPGTPMTAINYVCSRCLYGRDPTALSEVDKAKS